MSAQEVKFNIFGKLNSIPMVGSAIGYASSYYESAKGYSPIVASVMNQAEKTVQLVADSAKPVVNKLEKPLSTLDSLACRSLEKVEEYAPLLKKSPREIKQDALNKIEEVKKVSTERVVSLKDYGREKVGTAINNTYTQNILKSALDLTESAIDHYLPSTDQEPSDESKPENVLQRVSLVSDKMKRRLQKQLFTQVDYLHKRTTDVFYQIQNLRSTIAQKLGWMEDEQAAASR